MTHVATQALQAMLEAAQRIESDASERTSSARTRRGDYAYAPGRWDAAKAIQDAYWERRAELLAAAGPESSDE